MVGFLFFHLLTFPWSFLPGNNVNEIDGVNCSRYDKDWCYSLRPVNLYIYYISYVLVFGVALPCLNNSLQSLYSLVLGNNRQGTMQGINQAVGSISRISGPLLIT